MWNKTITLYNKHENNETGEIEWYRHKLENCFYKVTNNKVNVGNIQMQTGNNIVRIPEQKNYLPPYKWAVLTENEKQKYITLQGGDLIFLGIVNEDIDEYTSGKRSSDLIAKYSTLGSVFISSININDFLPGAHYFVRGE